MRKTLQNGTSPAREAELGTDEAAVAGLLRHQLGIGIASEKYRQGSCVEANELRRLPIMRVIGALRLFR